MERRSIDSADIATINRPSSKTTKVILKLLLQPILSAGICKSSDARLGAAYCATNETTSESSPNDSSGRLLCGWKTASTSSDREYRNTLLPSLRESF